MDKEVAKVGQLVTVMVLWAEIKELMRQVTSLWTSTFAAHLAPNSRVKSVVFASKELLEQSFHSY